MCDCTRMIRSLQHYHSVLQQDVSIVLARGLTQSSSCHCWSTDWSCVSQVLQARAKRQSTKIRGERGETQFAQTPIGTSFYCAYNMNVYYCESTSQNIRKSNEYAVWPEILAGLILVDCSYLADFTLAVRQALCHNNIM